MTYIGKGAFSGCSAVSTVTLPSSTKELAAKAFAECPNLTEVYCYAEELPYTRDSWNWETTFIEDLFKDSYIEGATLYVPESAIDDYKENETWNGFGTIKTLSGEGPEEQKCAAPDITYEGGILTFSCETEDVEYIYNLTPATAISGNGNNISAPTAYKVSVYATKSGYKASDVATATLVWTNAVLSQTTGITTSAKAFAESIPVLISAQDGNLVVRSEQENQYVAAYSIDGKVLGSAKVNGGQAIIPTNLPKDEIVIVKVGNRSVKVKM